MILKPNLRNVVAVIVLMLLAPILQKLNLKLKIQRNLEKLKPNL